MVVWIVLFVLSFLVFLWFEFKKQYRLAFLFKGLTSLLFVSTAVWGRFVEGVGWNSNQIQFAALWITALIMGLLGDLFLVSGNGSPVTRFFQKIEESEIKTVDRMAGTISFAIAHVLNITALLLISTLEWKAVLLSVVVTAVTFSAGIYFMKLKFGKLLIPSIGYSLLLFFFFGQALFGGFSLGTIQFHLMVLIGAFLFALSDLVLTPILYGGKNLFSLKAINLTLYYAAQIVLAFSIWYLA